MSPPGKMLSGTSRGSAQKLKPSEVCIHHRAVLCLLAAWNQICIFIFARFLLLGNHRNANLDACIPIRMQYFMMS